MDQFSERFLSLPVIVQYLAIIALGSILFIPLLGGVHLFDWDEINFAECAREMIVTGDYSRCQIDFMPFWEKPPVFIWLQAASMKMFGVSEFAARFPNALAGILTLATLFFAGKKVSNPQTALWWVLMYAASWLPHFYFKTGIIDPIFNYLIFLAIFQFFLLGTTQQIRYAVSGGLLLGLAVLTKGPVAALVTALTLLLYIALPGRRAVLRPAHLAVAAACCCVPFFCWMGYAAIVHGTSYATWFMTEFLRYQVRLFTTEDADHGGPFFYHWVVLLFGCFPASVFFVNDLLSKRETAGHEPFRRLMHLLFIVVLLLFSIVKTKIVHYSSLCYYPLTFVAARNVSLVLQGGRFAFLPRALFLATGAVFVLLLVALPVIGMNKHLIIPLIDDPFAVGNLQAAVTWSFADSLWGAGYLGVIVYCSFLLRSRPQRTLMLLIPAQIIVIQAIIVSFTPRIEAYSQRAAITFFKQFKGKEVYIRPLGYKSFAYLFYAEKMPFAPTAYYSGNAVNEHWLRYGKTDRPVFFITKQPGAAQYDTAANLIRTGGKNGFVFFRKK